MVAGRRPETVHLLSSGHSSQAFAATVGSERWVARVPIEGSGRHITYNVEAALNRSLISNGHPVANWSVVDVEDVPCSVARRLPGAPVRYDQPWSAEFGQQLAQLLHALHTVPAEGFGPLINEDTGIRGSSDDRTQGVVDRWFHAPIWPFDGSTLDAHPVGDRAPDLARIAVALSDRIESAESDTIGVVHSDLHREHLLQNDDGALTGVLDLGDAFIGAVAWDFALLNWYYGKANALLVAHHYPNHGDVLDCGVTLSIAVGLYKLAKNPADPTVVPRLRRCINTALDT